MGNNNSRDSKIAGSSDCVRVRVNERVAIFKNNKSPYWQLDYSSGGRQHRPSTKTDNKKVAIELANRKYKDLVLGTAIVEPAVRMTVDDGIEQFLCNRKEKRQIADSTLNTYRANLNDLARCLRGLQVTHFDQLRPEHLDGFEQYLRQKADVAAVASTRRRGKVSNSSGTLHNKLVLMKRLVKFAVAKGWIDTDPARAYELPKRSHVQAYCWNADELASIVANVPEPYKDEVNFLRLTGLRAGEFSWLAKADVDLDKRLIRVCEKTTSDGTLLWKPKTGNGRVVPLCDEAVAIARRRMTADDAPWLFSRVTRAGNRRRVSRGQIRYVVRSAMQRAGVERGTTHTLRHAFCSYIANNGVPPLMAMKIMGHRSLDIILIYYHVDEQDLSRAFGKVTFTDMLAKPAGEGLETQPTA